MKHPENFKRWPPLPKGARLVPTHTCFDDSWRFIESLPDTLLPRIRDKLTIVHALLRDQNGEIFAHAWLEGQAELFFVIQGASEPIMWERAVCSIGQHERSVYYCSLAKPFYQNVVKRTRYPLALAAELSQLHGMHGPWREEYKQHCDRGRTLHPVPHAQIIGVFEQLPARGGESVKEPSSAFEAQLLALHQRQENLTPHEAVESLLAVAVAVAQHAGIDQAAVFLVFSETWRQSE